MPAVIIRRREAGDEAPVATLTLSFDQRQRSRLRATLDDGREVALVLERGQVLRDGDRLRGDCGTCIAVAAGAEPVSRARAADPLALTRAAYHLGNRHVPLQIEAGELRYLRDHVLDDMVRGLGIPVEHDVLPFEPEAGAYGGGHHHHP